MTSTAAHVAPTTRSPADGVAAALGLAVVVATAALAWDQAVPGWERRVFGLLDHRTVVPYAVVWPVMQLGNVLVPVLGAAVAAAARRLRLAVTLVTAALAAYWLARAVKVVVARPRPAELLDGVVVRGPHVTGNGFVSGHAAVAAVTATVLLPCVPRRWRPVLVGLVLVVALARVHVGAHLPLDVVGGVALGAAVGAASRLLLGPGDALALAHRRRRGST